MTKRSLKVLTLIICVLSLTPFQRASASDKYYVTTRIYGQNRYETSFNIAENFDDSMVDNVILANGENFPDALSGSVLSKKFNAPILLVDNSNFDNNKYLQDYIYNHLSKGGNIYLLGGEASVSPAYVSQLKKTGNYNFIRLGGKDRFDTNISIVDEMQVKTGTPVIIVSEENFPDALSISSVAALRGYPILMSNKDNLPDKIGQELSIIKPSKVYIIGGNSVVSDQVRNQVQNILDYTGQDDIVRIYGDDRYETSLNICRYFNLDSNSVVLANGTNFPDALSGSALAAKLNSPIILIDGEDAEKQKGYIDSVKYNRIFILGGNTSVSSTIEDSFKGENLNIGSKFGKDYNSIIVDYKIGDVIGNGSDQNVILTNDEHNVSKLIIQDSKTGSILFKKAYNDYFPPKGKIELSDMNGDKVKDIIVTMEYGGSALMQACDIETFKNQKLTFLGTNMNETTYFPMQEDDLTFSLLNRNSLNIYSNISKKRYTVDLSSDKYINDADKSLKIYPYVGHGPRFLTCDVDSDGVNELGIYQDISGANRDDIIASFITYYKYQESGMWKPVECMVSSNYPIYNIDK